MALDREYMSDIDKFLKEFNKTNELSSSQQRELAKHKRIFKLRDDPEAQRKQSELWEDF